MFKAWMCALVTTSIGLLVASVASGQTYEVRSFYRGIRSLGMGGAGIAAVNDETALLVNPAGLGKLRDVYGTIIDPEFEGSTNWPAIYTSSAFSNPLTPDSMQAALAASPDTHFHSKVQLFPSFVVRNFGVGIYTKRLLDARVDPTQTNMRVFYQDDMALVLGFNFRLWGGRIKLGATGKIISRIEIDDNLPIADGLTVAGNASEGLGLGIDAGLMLTAPIVWLPSLTAVARDVGGTSFSQMTGVRLTSASQPVRQEQDIDVGFSLSPIHGTRSRSVFTAEYQKISQAAAATDKIRYVHVGYEYNFADLFFLRAGMNQRYWTAGFEFSSENTQIQFAYYGEDIGPDGAPEEDRRWVWKFVFRF